MTYLMERITVDPQVCGGRACIRGLRIRVTDILDLLAAGLSAQQVVEELPDLELADVEAAGHRLALELECLLMDTKDLPTVSRWWASGMEAMDEWQKLFPYNGPRLGD